MKKENRDALIFSILGFIIVLMLTLSEAGMISHPMQPGHTGMMPLPTDEGPDDQQKREQWMEEMHQAATGVNWRMLDLQHRISRMERYFKTRSSAGRSGLTIAGTLSGQWEETGSRNMAGRIHVAELDTIDQLLYCASSGGQIWRTPFGSTTQWEVLTDHFQVKGIHLLRVVRQAAGLRILIASDASSTPGFYYSDDTCRTWTPSTGTMTSSWGYVRRAVVANDSLRSIYLLAQGWSGSAVVRILVSTDLGGSFQEVLSFPESQVGSIRNCDLWTDRYGTGRLFFARGNQIHEIVQGLPVFKGTFVAATQNQVRLTGYERGSAAVLYAMDVGQGNSTCYKSDNDGVTWTWKGSVQETPFMINSFACSATNPSMVYFGGVEAYYSPTSGVNWYLKNAWGDYYSNMNYALHADIPGLCPLKKSGGSEVLFICTDGGIYRSDNSMAVVNNLSMQDLNVSQYYSVYTSRVNTGFIHAGSQDQGYQRSNSQPGAVKSFDQVWSGDYGHIVSGDGGMSIWMNYPGFTVHYNDILYSTSRTWWEFTFQNALWIPPMMIDPYDFNNVIIAGGSFSGGAHLIMITYTGVGAPMVPFEYPFDFSGGSSSVKITAVASSPLDKDCWYVLTSDGRFFHSPDAGYSWTLQHDFNFNFGHYFYGADILPSPNEKGKVYVCGSGYSNPPVFEMRGHGAIVRSISQGIPNTLVYALDCTPEEGLLFAATELGPYVFISGEDQWYDLSEGVAPDQTYWSVDYVESLKTARFGTYGRGIWDYDVCPAQGQQPQAAFASSAGTAYLEVNFQDQSAGDPFTWLWDFGDGTTSLSQSPTHFYSTPGSYTVRLIAGNICHRDTVVQTIQVTQTGIADNTERGVLSIFPNPASDVINLRTDGEDIRDILMYDLAGRVYPCIITKQHAGLYRIDVSALAPGTYFLQMKISGKAATFKVLISGR